MRRRGDGVGWDWGREGVWGCSSLPQSRHDHIWVGQGLGDLKWGGSGGGGGGGFTWSSRPSSAAGRRAGGCVGEVGGEQSPTRAFLKH